MRSIRPLLCAVILMLFPLGHVWAFQVQQAAPQQGGKVVRWAKQPVPIFLHQDGAPEVSDGSDFRAIQTAFDAWSKPSCNNLTFDIKQTTATDFAGRKKDPSDVASPFMKDGQSVVRFETGTWEFGDSVIAQNATFFDGPTGELQEADVLLNAVNFKWSADQASGTLDITTVMLQSIGKMIGLWFSEIPGAVMHPGFDLRRVNRSLQDDDIKGSCFLYPTSGWTDRPPPAPAEPSQSNEPPPPTPREATNQEAPTGVVDGGTNGGTPETPNTGTPGTGCQASTSLPWLGAILLLLGLLSLPRRQRLR